MSQSSDCPDKPEAGKDDNGNQLEPTLAHGQSVDLRYHELRSCYVCQSVLRPHDQAWAPRRNFMGPGVVGYSADEGSDGSCDYSLMCHNCWKKCQFLGTAINNILKEPDQTTPTDVWDSDFVPAPQKKGVRSTWANAGRVPFKELYESGQRSELQAQQEAANRQRRSSQPPQSSP